MMILLGIIINRMGEILVVDLLNYMINVYNDNGDFFR